VVSRSLSAFVCEPFGAQRLFTLGEERRGNLPKEEDRRRKDT